MTATRLRFLAYRGGASCIFKLLSNIKVPEVIPLRVRIRQVGFGYSKNPLSGSPRGSRPHREAASSHPADRERSRRRLRQVSIQNDSDDGATWVGILAALDGYELINHHLKFGFH